MASYFCHLLGQTISLLFSHCSQWCHLKFHIETSWKLTNTTKQNLVCHMWVNLESSFILFLMHMEQLCINVPALMEHEIYQVMFFAQRNFKCCWKCNWHLPKVDMIKQGNVFLFFIKTQTWARNNRTSRPGKSLRFSIRPRQVRQNFNDQANIAWYR